MEELCHGAHGRFSLGDFSPHPHAHTHANTYIHTYPNGNIHFHSDSYAFPHAHGDTHPYSDADTRAGGDHDNHRLHPSTSSGQAYDPLYRLTAADYDSGEFFHYSYDAVGNRLTQETHKGANLYAYDAANRLIEVDGVTYSWDANGNLIDDGERTYTYDHANRLITLNDQGSAYIYAYNGLGDRLQQTADGVTTNYSLDLNMGLTQVLDDDSNYYLYGLGRIGELQGGGWQYHLPDALGSVRQVADPAASITLAQSYEPFGSMLLSAGEAGSAYGFTGEWVDANGLLHLRARYYEPQWGRFFQPDPWSGFSDRPHTLHPYSYVGNNPVLYIDASGRCWGPMEWLGDTTFYGQTCSNLDMAWTITTSPEATFGQKAFATWYLITEGLAHTVAIGGTAVACLGGGCQAVGGTIGGLLGKEILTYGTMTYLGLDAMFIALDLGTIGYDTYLLWASGSCTDDELYQRLAIDIVGLGLDIALPGLGRGTSGGLKLAAQGGRIGVGAIEVARMTAAARGIQAVYKAGQLGVFIMAAADRNGYSDDIVRESWDSGTFITAEDSARYHFNKHGGPWRNLEEYTKEALRFLTENSDRARPHRLRTGEMGIKISTPELFGIYTNDGRIISFGQR